MAGTQCAVTWSCDFEFNAPKEVLNEMNLDRTDAEFVQKVSKTFMKGGDEKGMIYVYPV